MAENKYKDIAEHLSFLDYNKIHSIVLIGSVVFGQQEKGSDVDIVVICTEEGYNEINEILYKKI